MITAGDFRNGMTFEEDGNVLQIVEFQHVKPGKGAAFVRTKYKNIITGAVLEKLNIPTTTVTFTTLWTLRPMSSSLSAPLSFPTTSSLSRSR